VIWLHLFGHILFVLLLGYYLIQNLQWYNYRLGRVLLHHHAPWQHIVLFLLPFFAYLAFREWVWVIDIVYGSALWWWQRGIDKRLVFTPRVKRFFALLLLFTLVLDLLCLAKCSGKIFFTLLPLILALSASWVIERYLFVIFQKEAKKKLDSIDPTIVSITASYGKTSIKNFLYQLLEPDFKVYKTPRSVNTLAGILKDINEELPQDTQIYITEAGAREPGDIDEIVRFLQPHYVVVGKVGPQHIEYFKSLERIIATKLEILRSKRLKKAIVWDQLPVKEDERVVKFGQNIANVKASLDGVEWDLELDGQSYHFSAPVLGAFNALNITAAVLVAKELGVRMEQLQERVRRLQSVEHRLQKIEAGGKLIIDDSFNGNLEGMLASFELVRSYKGRKVIVTPGLVESDEASNIRLAKGIDETFDLVILTGRLNKDILTRHISKPTIVVDEKSKLQEILAANTKPGDLILFSNDAPSYM